MPRSNSKRSQQTLVTPNPAPSTLIDRNQWIDQAYKGFVAKGSSNREIYKVILETLWPEGHGIPGPIVTQDDIRHAIDSYKGAPYRDPFRRMRELQGEEGFLGIVKEGTKYQLISLNVSPKKRPRTSLPADAWDKILNQYNHSCAVCGAKSDRSGFQQDHKVPRSRGGNDSLTNWQPLCDACNIAKSVSCRGCTEDCMQCGWAYPEYYRPLRLSSSTLRALNTYADSHHVDPSELVTDLIYRKLGDVS